MSYETCCLVPKLVLISGIGYILNVLFCLSQKQKYSAKMTCACFIFGVPLKVLAAFDNICIMHYRSGGMVLVFE